MLEVVVVKFEDVLIWWRHKTMSHYKCEIIVEWN